MRVSRGGMRLKARAQAFGHPHYQLVTSKVEIFQDDLLTAKQLTIWQHSKLYLSRTTATIKLVNERTLSVYPFLSLIWKNIIVSPTYARFAFRNHFWAQKRHCQKSNFGSDISKLFTQNGKKNLENILAFKNTYSFFEKVCVGGTWSCDSKLCTYLRKYFVKQNWIWVK